MHKYGESKTTRIMMATVRHVTSSSRLGKFQVTSFLLSSVPKFIERNAFYCTFPSLVAIH